MDDAPDAQPLSMVIAIQKGRRANYEFARIRTLATMIEPLFSNEKAANGQTKAALVEFDSGERETNYICECADAGCFDTIPLANVAYERLRSDKQWFVVMPGHEKEGSLEQVIERWPGYVIVEKLVSVPDVTAGA